MNLAALWLSKQKKVPVGGHGFVYIVHKLFGESDTRRLSLVKPYTNPQVSVYGPGQPVLMSIGGPEPSVSTQGNTVTMADPRGFAGDSPVVFGYPFGELINNDIVNIANQQGQALGT